MKTIKYILILVSVFILLNACEDNSPQLVQISYQLKDNITPTYATFKLNISTKHSNWKLNEQYFYDSDTNFVVIPIVNPGKNIVSVETYHNGRKQIGEIEIYAPPRPNVLLINGFFIPEGTNFNFEKDSLRMEIYHNDNFENKSFSFYFKSDELSEKDTVIFKRPIILGLSKNDFSYDDSSVVYVRLSDKTNYLPKWYFKNNFFLFTELFIEQSFYGDNIVRLLEANDKRFHLLVDWR